MAFSHCLYSRYADTMGSSSRLSFIRAAKRAGSPALWGS